MTVKQWITSRLGKFSGDAEGAITIEFALTVPFLLALWLGAISMIDMENATTEVGKVTSTVADLLAQAPEINNQSIDNAFLASQAIIGGNRKNDLQMYVAGVRITKDDSDDDDEIGVATVVWSRGSNLTSLSLPQENTEYELNDGLLKREGFIVIAHGRLAHTPLYASTYGSKTENHYEYVNYFSPRNSLETSCTNC